MLGVQTIEGAHLGGKELPFVSLSMQISLTFFMM